MSSHTVHYGRKGYEGPLVSHTPNKAGMLIRDEGIHDEALLKVDKESV